MRVLLLAAFAVTVCTNAPRSEAATSYVVLAPQGKCTDHDSLAAISDRSECETAASSLDLEETSASQRSATNEPSGCYSSSGGKYLKINTYFWHTTPDCDANSCLCKFEGDDCAETVGNSPNGGTCKCGSNICFEAVGLYCDASVNKCQKHPICEFPEGKRLNRVNSCGCGTADCTGNEMFCIASENSCRGPCAGGYYASNTSSVSCTLGTKLGHYYPAGGTFFHTAVPCPVGRWSDQIGLASQQQCTLCPRGKWTLQNGSTSVNNCSEVCPTGKYSDVEDISSATECSVCLPGFFQDENGKSSCKSCASGTTTSGHNSTDHDEPSDCAVEIDLTDLQNRMNSMETTIPAVQTNVTTLETTIAAEQAKVTTLETTVAAEQAKVTTLETTIAAEQAKVMALETTVAAEQAKVSALELTVAAEQTKVSALKESLAREQKKVNSLESQLIEKDTVIAGLQESTN